MQINVSFRHIEPSDPLKLYAEEKLSRVKKFMAEPIEAHVVLKVEKFRHIAEISIDAPGLHLNGAEETDDMYSSIDLLVDTLEAQAKKGKDKGRRHRAAGAVRDNSGAPGAARREAPDDDEQLIIRTEQVFAKPMDIDEAVIQLKATTREFMVFTNRRTSRVNVLYRRKDGHLGLIETVG